VPEINAALGEPGPQERVSHPVLTYSGVIDEPVELLGRIRRIAYSQADPADAMREIRDELGEAAGWFDDPDEDRKGQIR
jgi:hypothetical protein